MGGAAGHMMHPFECPDVKTGNDLLALFEEAKNKVGSVKIDGTNVSFKLVDTPDGGKEFAGDRGSYDRMDVMGLTGANIGQRWEDPTHGMRSMYGLVVKILNDALNTKNPETGESIIKPELISLGMWDNPSKFINTEYVKGKTNQVAYPDSAKFLAFHGINQFYASAPRYPRQNQMARSEEMGYLPMPEEFLSMKRGDRPKSTPIQFDPDDLQSLIRKVIPFAKKDGFTVVHTIPTEHETDFNLDGMYDDTLSRPVNINLDENRTLTLNLKQWLNKVNNPIQNGEFLKVSLAASKDAKPALSKIVYQELINNQIPLNQLLSPEASEQEGQIAIDGAIIYYATLLLGADLLRSQKAVGEEAQGLFGDEMLNLSSHEGLVILDQDQLPFCGGAQVKFTGEFIEKGQDSPFRQVNENYQNNINNNLNEDEEDEEEEDELTKYLKDKEEGEDLLPEVGYVVMIPGGFKPPTAGHYNMIKSYIDDPGVKEVIVIQGPKDRDGVTNAESRAIFELYGGFQSKATFMVSRGDEKTPLETAYKLVQDQNFTNQFDDGTIFSIGASSKGGDDKRIGDFVEYFNNRPGILPEDVFVDFPPFVAECCVVNGMDLSASTMRKALAEGDLELVKMHLPNENLLSSVLRILDYKGPQKKTMMELRTLTDLYSLVESVMDEHEDEEKVSDVDDRRVPLTVGVNGQAELAVDQIKTKKRNPKEKYYAESIDLAEQEGAPPGIPPDQALEPAEQTLEGGAIQALMEFFGQVETIRDLLQSDPQGVQETIQQIIDPTLVKRLIQTLLKKAETTVGKQAATLGEDLDEISSMGGGNVAGYASAGNNDKDEPGGLIREEDIIEQVMKKITSGDYYYE